MLTCHPESRATPETCQHMLLAILPWRKEVLPVLVVYNHELRFDTHVHVAMLPALGRIICVFFVLHLQLIKFLLFF